jgi:hypothetical protein
LVVDVVDVKMANDEEEDVNDTVPPEGVVGTL